MTAVDFPPVRRIALVLLFAVAGCKKAAAPPAPAAESAPTFFPDRAAVLQAIESQRFSDADKILATAPGTADVHFLKGKLAEARMDGETAYRELETACTLAPDWAEYQYELGVVAPLPLDGQTAGAAEGRFEEGGKALAKALALHPDDPKYEYARAYFLSVAPAADGGDPVAGRKLFDALIEKHPDGAWAHRVKFDRAAEAERWEEAESEAGKAGEWDAFEGARLWLQVAGTRLHQGDLEHAKSDLEAAAKLSPPAAGGFCDAGYALDGGRHPELADPFWKRCLELAPEGPKAAQAKARLGVTK